MIQRVLRDIYRLVHIKQGRFFIKGDGLFRFYQICFWNTPLSRLCSQGCCRYWWPWEYQSWCWKPLIYLQSWRGMRVNLWNLLNWNLFSEITALLLLNGTLLLSHCQWQKAAFPDIPAAVVWMYTPAWSCFYKRCCWGCSEAPVNALQWWHCFRS